MYGAKHVCSVLAVLESVLVAAADVWWVGCAGCCQVYANIGLMDLYYTISPDSSKSYAQALTLLTTGE